MTGTSQQLGDTTWSTTTRSQVPTSGGVIVMGGDAVVLVVAVATVVGALVVPVTGGGDIVVPPGWEPSPHAAIKIHAATMSRVKTRIVPPTVQRCPFAFGSIIGPATKHGKPVTDPTASRIDSPR
jgi:hypothetical protein